MDTPHVLLVDDEKIILKSLARELRTNNFAVSTAESGEEALVQLHDNSFDLVITDLKMEGMSGLGVVKHVKQTRPESATIILTGHGDLNSAIEAMRCGADDYLLKPCNIDELLFRVVHCLEKKSSPSADIKKDTGQALNTDKYPYQIVGEDPSMAELDKLIHEAAGVNLPVLIQGESGTGKELVARNIHDVGPRKDKPFIAVNCAALPVELVESELFGHVKGAFTGAVQDKKGRFELANNGTIFLDEIGELPLEIQVKLLRVLQENTFERVGDAKSTKINVRLICATNRQLEHEVKKNNFRLDLYYRVCVVPINVPPLRMRKDDVPLLVGHFVKRFGRRTCSNTPCISSSAVSLLKEYNWPGNIRELQNVVQFAMMKSKGETIEPDHFPAYLQGNQQGEEPAFLAAGRTKKLDEQSVLEALRRTEGNKTETAKILGVARATLYRFIKEEMGA